MPGSRSALAALTLTALACLPAAAAPKILVEEMMVPTSDAGAQAFVRNKRPDGVERFGPDRTVVFVHGATYPASTIFDLPLGGRSWMDDLAERGFDVYSIDLPGYGRATRPKAMSEPAAAGEPFTDTADAVAAVGSVVDAVLKRRGLSKVNVIGWSWGTAIMAGYTEANPNKVNRLVLFATLWHLKDPPPISAGAGKLGAYRSVTAEAAKTRWLTGVPEDKKAGLIPAGWFDQFVQATWATDPDGAKQTPAVVRAPNGVLQDIGKLWGQGRSNWDPAKITVPTLMALGEWDRDTPLHMSQAVFPALVNAPWKQFVLIGEGTHTLPMEKNRQQLFDAVGGFLEAKAPAVGQ